MNSRISREQERWLLNRADSAPWAVPRDALLVDADPAQHDGLYDDALALYRYFSAAARPGLGRAKISKCLYLMRPGLIPILVLADTEKSLLTDS